MWHLALLLGCLIESIPISSDLRRVCVLFCLERPFHSKRPSHRVFVEHSTFNTGHTNRTARSKAASEARPLNRTLSLLVKLSLKFEDSLSSR
jgi:hypothetical protein